MLTLYLKPLEVTQKRCIRQLSVISDQLLAFPQEAIDTTATHEGQESAAEALVVLHVERTSYI
jgi:hypothetical protein